MTTIVIDGALKRKAWLRLRNNKPLTIVIKGVGTFKAYMQNFEQEQDVRPMHNLSGKVVTLMPGPVTTTIKTSSFYFRR